MPKYQTDETTFSRIFLRELSEEADLYERTKKTFIVSGTVVRIFKSNEIICSFMLEDFTRAQVVESFADKLPIDFALELGDILEIKGNFVLNKFNERVIRLLKVRKITLNEEMIHYLEILHSKKQKRSQGFNEEAVLINDAEVAAQSKIQFQPNAEITRRKLASMIFSFANKNYDKYRDCQGLVKRAHLEALPEVKALRSKFVETEIFDKMFEEVLGWLENSELIAIVEPDIVLNLDFFENFDDNFLFHLDQEAEVTFRTLFIIFNNMIIENGQNMINKEGVWEYINKLIFRKKITPVENKKETFRKI